MRWECKVSPYSLSRCTIHVRYHIPPLSYLTRYTNIHGRYHQTNNITHDQNHGTKSLSEIFIFIFGYKCAILLYVSIQIPGLRRIPQINPLACRGSPSLVEAKEKGEAGRGRRGRKRQERKKGTRWLHTCTPTATSTTFALFAVIFCQPCRARLPSHHGLVPGSRLSDPSTSKVPTFLNPRSAQAQSSKLVYFFCAGGII